MKHTWVAYTVTGVIAAIAGIAIAGLPSTPDGADLVVTALPSTTTSTIATPTTTTPPTTLPTTTTTADATTTTAATTTTSASTTTVALRDRASLAVGVANATDQTGVAGSTADELRALGYTNVSIGDTTPSDSSMVFYVDGLEREAARLAADAGLDPTAIAPYAQAPELATPANFELLLVVGLDQV